MTYDEFWTGECKRVIAYRKANYKRIESRNESMWLQGLYVYNAMGSVLNATFSSKGQKKLEYVKEPYNILPKTGNELKREQERAREKAINALTAWADTWAIKHK